MQRTFLTLLATASLAAVAHAQNPSAPPRVIVVPATPAPTVASVPTSANTVTQAPVVIHTPTVATGNPNAAATPTATGATQIVYTPHLPSATDLTNAAAAQGLTVERIVQTTNQVIAFYRNGSGQTTTVAYQTLAPTGVTQTPAPAVVVTQPPPTVVYRQAPRVIYYDDYPGYYYPRYWYPPVSLSLGFGIGRGHHHGGHHHRR